MNLPLTSSFKKIGAIIFVSIFVLATIQNSSFLIQTYLEGQSRELSGGDIHLESSYNIKKNAPALKKILEETQSKTSEVIKTNSIVLSSEKELSSFASLKIIDTNYPLYGKVILQEGTYSPLKKNEVYIESNIAKTLEASIGQIIIIGKGEFTIKDILKKDAQSSFSFNMGRSILISQEGFSETKIDENKSRIEYNIYIKGTETEMTVLKRKLEENITNTSIRLRTKDDTNNTSRLIRNVEIFLLYSILFGFLIGMLGIYLQVNNQTQAKMHTYSLLLALGMTRKNLTIGIISDFLKKSLLVIIIAIIASQTIVYFILPYVQDFLGVKIEYIFNSLIIIEQILAGLISTIISITIPILQLNFLSPASLLKNNIHLSGISRKFSLLLFLIVLSLFIGFLTLVTNDIIWGSIITIAIFFVSLIFIAISTFIIKIINTNKFNGINKIILLLIKRGRKFSFFTITTIGILSYIFCSIILLETNLRNIANSFINNNAPNTILIDIQKNQKETLELISPNPIELYPVIRSRITQIDQQTIEPTNRSIDRELLREFNISFRDFIDKNESIHKGRWWNKGNKEYQVSVEQESAKRFGIKIGSEIVFDIQGRKIGFIVTSLRKIERDTGLPFFYFIMPQKTLENAPYNYFGFTSLEKENVINFQRILSEKLPNITLIETSLFQEIIKNISIQVRNVLYAISMLFYILGGFLIISLFESIVKKRKRTAALFRTIGMTKKILRKTFAIQLLLYSVIGFLTGLILSMITVWNISIFSFDNINFYFSFHTFYTLGLFLILFTVISYFVDSKIIQTTPRQLFKDS